MCNFLRLRCLSEPQKVVFENYYNSYAEAQSLHNMFRSQAGSPSHMAMKEGAVEVTLACWETSAGTVGAVGAVRGAVVMTSARAK